VICITITNRKGGTGKSLGTYSLASTYAARGARVICCDLDGQGSLTSGYFGPVKCESIPKERTVAALFDPELAAGVKASDVIHPTGIDRIHIIPANNTLTAHNIPVVDMRDTRHLAQFLGGITGYDICLIDTPPNLQLSTLSAIAASDWVITILACEDFASQGIVHVLRAVDDVRAGVNPRVKVLGLLLNMHDHRLAVHRAYEKVLRDKYQDLVFAQRIPLAAVLKESVSRRTPIALYKPTSPAAMAFWELATEIDARVRGTLASGYQHSSAGPGVSGIDEEAADGQGG
jgi:chromosome partitioning protein